MGRVIHLKRVGQEVAPRCHQGGLLNDYWSVNLQVDQNDVRITRLLIHYNAFLIRAETELRPYAVFPFGSPTLPQGGLFNNYWSVNLQVDRMFVGTDSCAAFIRICAWARINSCLQHRMMSGAQSSRPITAKSLDISIIQFINVFSIWTSNHQVFIIF
jgi:hypothetical protein